MSAHKKSELRVVGGNKTQSLVALMRRRPVTREEALKMTKWKAISMQQVCDKAGVKLHVNDNVRPFKYRVVK